MTDVQVFRLTDLGCRESPGGDTRFGFAAWQLLQMGSHEAGAPTGLKSESPV